ncbi:MAG: 6-phosphofructokinase, partial [Elusimicrobia bacterium]|nr:6-phosphofructokinase [Elusimicrobiota bacterium]
MAGKVGLVVGGGPAPGINGVIAAATIEAVNRGKEVIGIRDGFKYLVDGDASRVMKLDIETVSRIHLQGGSILRTSRVNPTKNEETTKKVLECLKKLDIGYLIMIGGEGTLAVANIFDRTADGALKIVHVPKTIDNDLPLPGNMPSFGFETAQHVGAVLVSNIMEDAKTTSRWFFVVAMGRGAGHLALGIAKAAGT